MVVDTDVMIAEFGLWSEYQKKLNALHAQVAKADDSGACGYVYGVEMHPVDDPLGFMPDAMMKIGYSKHPHYRLKDLRRTNVVMPYTLELAHVWWAEDMRDSERVMHQCLRRYRVDGEWFKLPQEIWDHLGQIWYFTGSHESPDGVQIHLNIDRNYEAPIEFFTRTVNEFRERSKRSGRMA